MKSFLSLALFFILLISSSSCASKKAHASHISNPDYNQRIKVENPGIIKKENALGISISIGITGLGGYLGYEHGPIKTTGASKTEIGDIGNSVLGALLGYSLSRLTTDIFYKKQVNNSIDINDWLNLTNGSYTFVNPSLTNTESLELIHTSAETNYIVKNFNDVLDFHSAFPKSTHYENMLSHAFFNIKREKIPEILKLYPRTSQKNKFKLHYLESSPNVSKLKKAIALFPETKEQLNTCNIIDNLVNRSSQNDLLFLLKEFSSSSCSSKIETKLIADLKTVEDCAELVRILPSLSDSIGKKAMNIASSIQTYYSASLINENNKILAEKKAYALAKTLEKRKEFVKYFKTGNYFNKVTKEINLELSLREDIRTALYDFIIDESLKIANEVSSFNSIYRDDIRVRTLVKPDFSNLDKVEGDYQINWSVNYNDIGDSGGINLAKRSLLSLVINNPAPLAETKKVPMSIKGKASIDRESNKIKFTPYYYSKYVEKSKNWSKDRFIYLGTVTAISFFTFQMTQYLSDGNWNVEESNEKQPCYQIIDEEEKIFGNIVYTVECKNGSTKKVLYNKKYNRFDNGKGGLSTFSFKTKIKALKSACDCY